LYYSGIALFYNYLNGMNSAVLSVSVLIIAGFIPAVITGTIFRELTNETKRQNMASAVYSADLAGSALGFIIISGITVPVIGIQGSIFLLSGLILVGLTTNIKINEIH